MEAELFAVVYEFVANPGMESELEAAWHAVTLNIYRDQGSLGSRLHRTADEGRFVAYAQWPDEATFVRARARDDDREPADAKAASEKMKRAMKSVRIVEKMHVSVDELKCVPSGGAQER